MDYRNLLLHSRDGGGGYSGLCDHEMIHKMWLAFSAVRAILLRYKGLCINDIMHLGDGAGIFSILDL